MNYFTSSQISETARIKVLVAHGQPVVSAGLAATLARESRFDVLATASSHEEVSQLPANEPYDVIVTDRQGAPSWLVRARGRASSVPELAPRILIVDDSDGEAQVRAALSAGVHGYMLTNCGLLELVEGIGQLGRGGRYLCSSVANRMAESLTRSSLTPREGDVLALIVRGHSNKIIARQLGIAVGTVKAHSKAIFEKLGVHTRSQAVALSIQRGLVPEADLN